MNRMAVLIVVVLALLATLLVGRLRKETVVPTPLEQLKLRYAKKHLPSVDHAKLPALQREFSSPQDVTQACLSCHTERGNEVLASSHWNWEREEFIEGHGIRSIGKKNVANRSQIVVLEPVRVYYGTLFTISNQRDAWALTLAAMHLRESMSE